MIAVCACVAFLVGRRFWEKSWEHFMESGIRPYSIVFQKLLKNGRIPYKIFFAPRIHIVGSFADPGNSATADTIVRRFVRESIGARGL
jgi:hypothetical protein